MKALARNAFYNLRSSFGQVQGNARIIVLLQPFWSVANALFSPYLTQYMLDVGCDTVQVGVINAVSMAAGAVIGLFAGWITDRLGRRWTTFFADTLCWAVACLLWGLSSGFVMFLLGYISNAFVRLISVSWNCALTEDTPPERRLNAFWWLSIVNTAAIFFTPLMSLLTEPLGLVKSMRIVLLFSAGLYLLLFLIRHRYLKETSVGHERRKTSRGTSPFEALRALPPLFRLLAREPVLLTFFLIRSLYYVQMTLKGTFLSVAVVQGIGFKIEMIGTINLVTGAVMLLTQLLLLPRLQRHPPHKPLMAGLFALLASNVLLLFAPQNDLWMLMISTVVSAGGAVITGLLVDTLTANAMPDQQRAPLLGLTSILIVVVSAPFQYLGGWLAELPGMGPRLPMLLITALFAACMALLAYNTRRERRAGRERPGEPA